MEIFVKIAWTMCIAHVAVGHIEPPLSKSKIIQHITSLSPYYDLSFDLKPYGIIHGWSNILHVTVGGNDRIYGDRNPAVFFHPLTTKLLVCSSINGNKNYCWTSKALAVHQYSNIRIAQLNAITSGKLYFQIYINGHLNHTVENKDPRFFGNVKVYSANQWHAPANAHMKNFKIINNPNPTSLTRGQLVAERTRISPFFDLSFDIQPFGIVHDWRSVIHITRGRDGSIYGDRYPGVWIAGATSKLYIASAISGNRNYVWYSPALPIRKVSKLRITQQLIGDRIYFKVFINGVQKFSILNSQSKFFSNMKIYGSDPWYPPANALVTNFTLKDSFCY